MVLSSIGSVSNQYKANFCFEAGSDPQANLHNLPLVFGRGINQLRWDFFSTQGSLQAQLSRQESVLSR